MVANPALQGKVECRWQANPRSVFHGVLDNQEWVDFTMCNPPFHASAEDMARICHPHPTYSEGIKEAALAATENRALHV